MIYREAGQFKTSYNSDQALLPITQDRFFVISLLVVAYLVIPFLANDYWLNSIFLQFFIFALAALGLNILTGYAGQLSLGTGGFMACGAFSAYKLATSFPDMHIIIVLFIAGLITALVGMLFGIPSLRIKGFYLAVSTLAAQFFLLWLFNRVPWFTNYSSSGVISPPPIKLIGDYYITGPQATNLTQYFFTLTLVVVMALGARNIIRGHIGRSWMAMRDMDIAAEIIGISPLRAKLSAFAVSSFYCGIAGALWAFLYTETVQPLAFEINQSFLILFMIIIGGLGSILGSFFGAAFILVLPIFLNSAPALLGLQLSGSLVTHIEFMVFGVLIVFFLIVEPHGLARLWGIAKEKLRLWPFPY